MNNTWRIDETESNTIAAGNTVTLKAAMIPPKTSGAVTIWTNTADSSGWGKITWNCYLNGVKIPELSGIMDQYGSLATRRTLGRAVPVRGGDLFEVKATNGDSVSHSAGASFVIELDGDG